MNGGVRDIRSDGMEGVEIDYAVSLRLCYLEA